MKNISILIVMIWLSQGSLFAQPLKNSFSLSAGPSFPLGEYGRTSASDFSAGSAAIGKAATLSYSREMNKGFGIVVNAFYQKNGLNTQKFARSLAETGFFENYYRYHPYNPYDSPPQYYGGWEVKESNAYFIALLAGVYKEIRVSGTDGKLFIVPKISGGIGRYSRDSVEAFSMSDTAYAEYGFSKLRGIGGALLLGVDIGYKLSPRFDLCFRMEHFQTTRMSFGHTVLMERATNGGIRQPGLHDIYNGRNGWLWRTIEKHPTRRANSLNANASIVFHF